MRKAILVLLFTLVGCYNNVQIPSKDIQSLQYKTHHKDNNQDVVAYGDQFGFAKNQPLAIEPKSEYAKQQELHHQHIQTRAMQRAKEQQKQQKYKFLPKSHTTIPIAR